MNEVRESAAIECNIPSPEILLELSFHEELRWQRPLCHILQTVIPTRWSFGCDKVRTFSGGSTGSSKKLDGIWNRYNLKSIGRIYTLTQIETFEQETVSMVIFMQDGAPPRFICFVTDVLNERFPDAWIGRGRPIPWPPRRPDLSPLDFFLWGYIKNIVYAEKIRNIQHLQERITSAIETVNFSEHFKTPNV